MAPLNNDSRMIQLSDSTKHNSHKERRDKFALPTTANEFGDRNDNQKRNFVTFTESDLMTVSQ